MTEIEIRGEIAKALSEFIDDWEQCNIIADSLFSQFKIEQYFRR